MNLIRVRATESVSVPQIDESGRTVMGRFVGKSRSGDVIPEGVDVPESAYFLRAIARGELEKIGGA